MIDEQQAFPMAGESHRQYIKGMTLRDYFAAKALQGRMAGDYPWSDLEFKPVDGLTALENEAVLAYRVADAMMEARKREG